MSSLLAYYGLSFLLTTDSVSGGGRALRAVVRLRHPVHPETPAGFSAVGVGHVVTRVQRLGRHDAVSGYVLALPGDAPQIVVRHQDRVR